MNDDLQKQIAEILKQAVSAAQKGGEWIAGQIPDVLHQLIVWTVAVGVIALIAQIILGAAWMIFIPRHWRWVHDDGSYGDRELTYIPVGVALLASIPISAFLIDSALDGAKAMLAPKLFLLEYAAHVLK